MTALSLSDGGFRASVHADSISPSGARLSTFELTFPRFVLSEFNTHRVFSRNSASSRAIPVYLQILKIVRNPVVPVRFGVNQGGMQASTFLSGDALEEAQRVWLRGRDRAVWSAMELLLGEKQMEVSFGPGYLQGLDLSSFEVQEQIEKVLTEFQLETRAARQEGTVSRFLDVHKQTANRVLEPYAWHTVLVSATEWSNFLALRDSVMAQPEIEVSAKMVRRLLDESNPDELDYDQWHLPLLHADERPRVLSDPDLWLKVAVGRCARVSSETHDRRRDLEADVKLYDRLLKEGHMSPFEHIAKAMPLKSIYSREEAWSGNFRGFLQLRKTIENESDFSRVS